MKTSTVLFFKIQILLILLLILNGCDTEQTCTYRPKFGKESTTGVVRYVIGVHPLHNPQRLLEVFGPVAELLTREIRDSDFEIEASRNYAAFDKKLYSGKFEFALPNPYQTVLSLNHNYRVFGKMGDDANFRGIILVRKDSNIKNVTDLKGKRICFPAPTALAATMMPQYYLYENGLDLLNQTKIQYVGSQESSIMNVLLKNADACATWPPPWLALSKERPWLLDELEVKWQTKPLLNNGLVVRADIPYHIVQEVSEILFGLHKNAEGRAILNRMELSKFEPASDETYQPVNEFLLRFNADVRPIIH